jgi:hypothetical protein
MAKLPDQAGIKFTLHDMRRTYTNGIDGETGYGELKPCIEPFRTD